MSPVMLIFIFIGAVFARPDVGLGVAGGYNYHQNAAPRILPNTAASEDNYDAVQQVSEEPVVNKHFYIHSAPEDDDTNRQPKHFVLGKPQKNYRVVFIKAPSSGLANSQLSAQYAPQEEKTHIYVLSQKEHEINLNDIATPEPTQPSKPEVFFIKYKTPQEAEHAQRQIQAQYDSLGGESQVSDEGVAPHSSFVGSLGSPPSTGSRPKSLPPPKPLNNGYLPSRLL